VQGCLSSTVLAVHVPLAVDDELAHLGVSVLGRDVDGGVEVLGILPAFDRTQAFVFDQ
jgi:hypothetical protein